MCTTKVKLCCSQKAVNGAAFATFVASGQTCIMGARVLVHRSVYDKFVTALSEKAAAIRMGNPMDISTQVKTKGSLNSLLCILV